MSSAGRNLAVTDFELAFLCLVQVCATCVGAGDARLSALRFQHVLVDECTQASEPEALIALVLGAKQVRAQLRVLTVRMQVRTPQQFGWKCVPLCVFLGVLTVVLGTCAAVCAVGCLGYLLLHTLRTACTTVRQLSRGAYVLLPACRSFWLVTTASCLLSSCVSALLRLVCARVFLSV